MVLKFPLGGGKIYTRKERKPCNVYNFLSQKYSKQDWIWYYKEHKSSNSIVEILPVWEILLCKLITFVMANNHIRGLWGKMDNIVIRKKLVLSPITLFPLAGMCVTAISAIMHVTSTRRAEHNNNKNPIFIPQWV